MGKPFEQTYSPANWTAPAGGIATQWSAPYGGLNVQTPENLLDPSQTPSMSNFMFRNAELRSRPNFRAYLPGPDGNNAILGVGSFLSKNLVWHTFAFTVSGLYQLAAGAQAIVAKGQNPWTLIGGPPLSAGAYVRWRVFQSVLYYSNGMSHISAWDGAALTPITDAAFLGAGVAGKPPATTTTIGSLFIGELDSHLILAYTTETPIVAGVPGITATFPQRIRWSNSGFNPFDASGNFGANLGTTGATFDPTVFVNAGQVDFLDVPDTITGMLFLGRVSFIFRQNGITEVSPTGQGGAPFDFNHLWASENGIGNVYAASIAQYGDTGVFVSTDNIYMISPSSVKAIGGGARDAIFADLANTFFSPTAVISPAYTLGYTYLVYKLFIALANGNTRVYVYSFEDNNWAAWTITNATVGIPAKCWIGDTPLLVTSQQTVVGGSKGSGSGGGGGTGGGFTGGGGGGHQGGNQKQ